MGNEEIRFFIQRYAQDQIPDFQPVSLAMEVFITGMTPEETADLPYLMMETGDLLDLQEAVHIAVDKHSTGGVGDKAILVVEPVVSAYGLPVEKMSGRGLGFCGGTRDNIESITGYRTDFIKQEYKISFTRSD